MRRRALLVASIAGGVVLAAGLSAFAQSPDVDANAQRIFTSVMSPYCPGLLLADCPSPAAFELRLDVRKRLAAGESPAAIEQDLYDRYGEVLRAVPRAQRLGVLLWAAPAIVLAASLGALARFVAGSRRETEPPAPPTPVTDPALAERLQDLLDEEA